MGEMVRLNAIQRQAPPTSLEPYCLDTDSIDVASKYRIVIATCVTAGGLHRLRLGVAHFTHVFVDEAGQAMEPECLLPVSLATGTDNAVVRLLLEVDLVLTSLSFKHVVTIDGEILVAEIIEFYVKIFLTTDNPKY